MLATSPSYTPTSSRTVASLHELLPTLVLAFLLAGTTLAQYVYVVPNPRLYVRWGELLFVASVLLTSGASLRTPRCNPSWAAWVAVAWMLATAVSVAQAVNIGHALLRHGEWLNHLLFSVTLWSFARDRRLPLVVACVAIPAGFMFVGADLFSTWLTLARPRSFDWFYGMPLASHVRHLGYYALAALIFSACPLLGTGTSVSRQNRLLAFCALVVCWGFLFWTGGRAAVGSGIVSLALMTWMAGKGRWAWTTAVWIAAALVGLWISTLFWTEDPKMGFLNAVERTAESSTSYGVNGFTTGRLSIWGIAIAATATRPWFGLGPDGYKFIDVPHHGIQPHGMPVQFFVEWGLIGLVCSLIMLAVVFWIGFRRILMETDGLRRTVRVAAFALITGCTLHSLVDGLYYHPQPLLFLFTGFALILLPLPNADSPATHPVLKAMTSRPTLWIATVLLASLFFFSSDLVARLLWS